MMREVQRVLQRRGLLFVCEARSEKWWDTENKKNLLKELLERVGFEIVGAVGEDIGGAGDGAMWQYFVVRR